MTDFLPSYVQGEWWTPAAPLGSLSLPKGTDVRDASTGEIITRVSTEGLDLTGALEYARTTGHASLAELTFHQRALLLKQFALALTERKDELYAISARTGATKGDSWVDIDGGIGVLFSYSGKGRRELPNSRVHVDGPVEPLSKDGSFLGRHVYTTLPGVAVQINAFNFPVWGSLEKLAPAFLAGMPTLVKPATPTGYLAEAMVRILVESGLLPKGSLQLVSGSVPDLFDHLRRSGRDNGDPADRLVFCHLADGQALDIVAARGEQAGNPREDAGFVVDDDRQRMAFGGFGLDVQPNSSPGRGGGPLA